MKKYFIYIFLIPAFFILSSYCVTTNQAALKEAKAFEVSQGIYDANATTTTTYGQSIRAIYDACIASMGATVAEASPSTHVGTSPVTISDGGFANIGGGADGRCAFLTSTTSNMDAAMFTVRQTTGNTITEFDIAINDNFGHAFGPFTDIPNAGTMSSTWLHHETALRHELGHGVGFLHNKCNNLMNAAPTTNTLLSFSADGVAGFTCLYGASCPTNSCCCDNDNNAVDGTAPGASGNADFMSGFSVDSEMNDGQLALTWGFDYEVDGLMGFNVYLVNDQSARILNKSIITYDMDQSLYTYILDNQDHGNISVEVVLENGTRRSKHL